MDLYIRAPRMAYHDLPGHDFVMPEIMEVYLDGQDLSWYGPNSSARLHDVLRVIANTINSGTFCADDARAALASIVS